MPNRIKNDTLKYINNNNPVKNFVAAKLKKTDNEKDKIKASELYEIFKKYDNDGSNITLPKFKNILASEEIFSKRSGEGVFYIKVKLVEKFGDLD